MSAGQLSRRRIAIVGLGSISESHLVAYQGLPGIEVVAAVEPYAKRRGEICGHYGVRGFGSVELMLAECRPDVCCILTPAQTHRQITELCASAGSHVLCEKPMAVSLPDAVAMDRACEAAGVSFFYGSSYRALPAVEAARDLIAASAIGEVRLIVEQVIAGEGARAYRGLSVEHYPSGGPGGGGNGLVDHGIHMLDIFPWLCGGVITGAFGRGDRTGRTPRPEFALLAMSKGELGVLLYDGSTRSASLPHEGIFGEGREWVAGRGWMGELGQWDPSPGSIRVYGSDGSILILHYANKLFINKTGRVQEQRLRPGATPHHFGLQLQRFCTNLDRGEEPAVSAKDGIRALRCLLAVYESESTGQWQLVLDSQQ